MSCYEQALQYRQEVGDEAGVATALGNMGTLYGQMGQYPAALICYQRALQIDLKVGQRLYVTDDLEQLANLYLSEESYELAQKLLDRSIPLSRRLGGKYTLCKQLLTQAELLHQRGLNAEALVFSQESKALAEEIRPEIYFAASLLTIRIHIASGQWTGTQGIEAFETLLAGATEDNRRAAILFEIWSLDPQPENVRGQTAELYRNLYATTPNILNRQRYQELTHQPLPNPTPLPELPAIVTESPVDMDTLLIQVDRLLQELT